jgi:hypothetical protein
VEAPAADTTEGSRAMKTSTIVLLILVAAAAVFLLVGLAGFFLAA